MCSSKGPAVPAGASPGAGPLKETRRAPVRKQSVRLRFGFHSGNKPALTQPIKAAGPKILPADEPSPPGGSLGSKSPRADLLFFLLVTAVLITREMIPYLFFFFFPHVKQSQTLSEYLPGANPVRLLTFFILLLLQMLQRQ